MRNTVYLYVFDTMADWEASYVIAELNSGRYFKKESIKFSVKTVGLNKEPIITMGGVGIIPDFSVEECSIEAAIALVLPGGDTWLEALHAPIFEKTKEFLQAGVLVAAICGATIGLANTGFLDERYHTSNDLTYLQTVCPNYTGGSFYRQEPAVIDANLITASGIAPLEFAYQVLKSLAVFSPQTLESWYSLYATREAKYFYALMSSIQA
ncbi:MAG TPA: type 1 glutamine amidotransferase family protein [Syntrophomonadaceae bacterium]|nr:type 1 glutamine amidotransferase family protein [Syntrophomonadaceae bacterium]